MISVFLSFVFLVPPWNWAHPVFEELLERSKRTAPMVQSTQKDQLNEIILVWNAVFTASVTFESHNSLNMQVPKFKDKGRVWLLSGVTGEPDKRRSSTVTKVTGAGMSHD